MTKWSTMDPRLVLKERLVTASCAVCAVPCQALPNYALCDDRPCCSLGCMEDYIKIGVLVGHEAHVLHRRSGVTYGAKVGAWPAADYWVYVC